MELREIYESYLPYANQVDWKNTSSTKLCNEYFKAKKVGDEYTETLMFSALIIKYWGTVTKSKQLYGSKTKFTDSDFYEWEYKGILKALQYKSWTNKNNKSYYQKDGANKVIFMCISSARKGAFYQSNLLKNKINFDLDNISYDNAFIEQENLICNSTEDLNRKFDLDNLTKSYIKEKSYMKAILLQSVRENGEILTSNKFKKSLEQLQYKELCRDLDVSSRGITIAINKYLHLSNKNQVKLLEDTVESMKNDERLLSIL